jgi:hypothetical protein
MIFDRPGIADSPYLVPEKSYFIESGIGFTDKTEVKDLLFPSVMLRKRILKSSELRVATSTFPQSIRLMQSVTEINPLVASIGVKQKITKEKNWRPESAFILNSYYNVSEKSPLKLSNFLWEGQLLFQSTLNNWFSINYNLGFIHNVNLNQYFINQSTCFNFQLTQKTGIFIENFNYFSLETRNQEVSYDFGLTHFISKNIQLDLSYIANYKNATHFGTILAGVSLNLPFKKY